MMVSDEQLQEAVDQIKPQLEQLCDGEAGALMAATILLVGMAKEQNFPMSFLHKMMDEMAASWDANMPPTLRRN